MTLEDSNVAFLTLGRGAVITCQRSFVDRVSART